MSRLGMHKLRGSPLGNTPPRGAVPHKKLHELWTILGTMCTTGNGEEEVSLLEDVNDLHLLLSVAGHVFADVLHEVVSTQEKVQFNFKPLNLLPPRSLSSNSLSLGSTDRST